MPQLEEQCEVSYWKEDAPVTREALMQEVKVRLSILVKPLIWLPKCSLRTIHLAMQKQPWSSLMNIISGKRGSIVPADGQGGQGCDRWGGQVEGGRRVPISLTLTSFLTLGDWTLFKVVATMSVGYDHLDLGALKERNIKVKPSF